MNASYASFNVDLETFRHALQAETLTERSKKKAKLARMRDLAPEQYRAVVGKCPPGWQHDVIKQRCYKVDPSAPNKFDEPRPEKKQSFFAKLKGAATSLRQKLKAIDDDPRYRSVT